MKELTITIGKCAKNIGEKLEKEGLPIIYLNTENNEIKPNSTEEDLDLRFLIS